MREKKNDQIKVKLICMGVRVGGASVIFRKTVSQGPARPAVSRAGAQVPHPVLFFRSAYLRVTKGDTESIQSPTQTVLP